MTWIKMRTDLADDPAVISIASKMEIPEDLVVGKLHRLWSWADRHTRDGRAPGIDARWVDRYLGGLFAEHLVSVGWLVFDGNALVIPRFESHNGQSAKLRATNTVRQRLSRADRDNGATGDERETIPRPYRRYVLDRDQCRCVYCGLSSTIERETKTSFRQMAIDHLIPSTRGGKTTPENLACSCKPCNNMKNDRTPEEWGVVPTHLSPWCIYTSGQIDDARHKRDIPVTEPLPERERERDKKISLSQDGPSDSHSLTDWLKSIRVREPWLTRLPGAGLTAEIARDVWGGAKNAREPSSAFVGAAKKRLGLNKPGIAGTIGAVMSRAERIASLKSGDAR